jgi:hypothetical protein
VTKWGGTDLASSVIPAGWLGTGAGQISVAAGVVEASGNWSTYAGGDTSGTTTLLQRLPQVIAMAQIGGAGSYYVEAIRNDGSAIPTPSTPPTTGQIAAAILSTPANLLATNASGYVTSTNSGGGPTAAEIATAVWTDLDTGTDFDTGSSIGNDLVAFVQLFLKTGTLVGPDWVFSANTLQYANVGGGSGLDISISGVNAEIK